MEQFNKLTQSDDAYYCNTCLNEILLFSRIETEQFLNLFIKDQIIQVDHFSKNNDVEFLSISSMRQLLNNCNKNNCNEYDAYKY